jgi:hypothetical protein
VIFDRLGRIDRLNGSAKSSGSTHKNTTRAGKLAKMGICIKKSFAVEIEPMTNSGNLLGQIPGFFFGIVN